jgi:hypothetical protein
MDKKNVALVFSGLVIITLIIELKNLRDDFILVKTELEDKEELFEKTRIAAEAIMFQEIVDNLE